MELLLNLVWLMLALPAYWIWRREAACAHAGETGKSLRCIMMLGCILILLFPVISATDDLHFIRPEMEESSSSKRALKQAVGDKSFSSLKITIAPAAAAMETALTGPVPGICALVLIPNISPLTSASHESRAQRGPPILHFA